MSLLCGGVKMGIWTIHGGKPLQGTAYIQGAKNAVLPILTATMVRGCVAELEGVPRLRDVENTLKILEHLGCRVTWNDHRVTVDSRTAALTRVPDGLMTQMRSSVLFLGSLLARFGESEVSMPGGCMLGPRPVNLHLSALETLGGRMTVTDDAIHCRAERLRGGEIHFPTPSVGATENAMLAACGAEEPVKLIGAAREPEIVDLQNFLRAMGVRISGAGTDMIYIDGMESVPECVRYRIMPDRIAAATVLCAGAGCGGDVTVTPVIPEHLQTITDALEKMGCTVESGGDWLRLRSTGRLHSPGIIETQPYPGFPTDAQPLLLAACLKAAGTTEFRETIFSGRLRHTRELMKLGGDISVQDGVARVTGVKTLRGTAVQAMDLRGGAALLVAGLMAEGETVVIDRQHISRGYENFDGCLRGLGAEITVTD